jgi:hypothetical protein
MISDSAGFALWDLKESVEKPKWTLPCDQPGETPINFVWPTKYPDYFAYLTPSQLIVSKI